MICCTFFFCLPPPDFTGFEDGGGAFSFFGAYEKTPQINEWKHNTLPFGSLENLNEQWKDSGLDIVTMLRDQRLNL